MTFLQHLHMLARCWRYRLRSEAADLAELARLDLKGRTAIDIGANRGIYCYWLSKFVGPQGKVIGFELQPELHDALEGFKRRSSMRNVEVVMQGLSNKSGLIRIHRSHAGSTGACVIGETTASTTAEIPEGYGKLARLDDYCREHNIRNVAVIKCDVEGHERQVFEGAEETLRRHKPVLLFEAFNSLIEEDGLFDYLGSLGYAGYFFSEGKRYDAKQFKTAPFRRADCVHRNYFFTPTAEAQKLHPAAVRYSRSYPVSA
ncbi:FkbM family methyltransferase [Blastopirellula sp. JC732]|uniref:FkbM family methyltransferase n=1 Tax=Blastopirellula sediminis TaxID=2894196 RepID=A0A9X1MNG2_9BACT|nr:FkbM family methyltransferase [Blastopirellula sediminis]MCC9607292.1 FkbM family methyltransferase [Blastopirellula sediminis]MCC9629415.1 FkbM family methyltransferase [Blastopirellula sediminis]